MICSLRLLRLREGAKRALGYILTVFKYGGASLHDGRFRDENREGKTLTSDAGLFNALTGKGILPLLSMNTCTP
jgi:hypothetical protein